MNKREAILLVDDFLDNENTTKVMTLFDNKPFLEYLLDFYNLFGFNHFVLMVKDKKNPATNYFGNKYRNSKLIWTVADGSLGDVGAIKAGMEETESEQLLVASASVLFRANIGKFYYDHCTMKNSVSALVYNKQDANDNVVVETDISGRIKNISSKTYSSKRHLYFSGIYMIDRKFLQSEQFLDAVSFENDILKEFFRTEQFQVMVSKNYYLNINCLKQEENISLNKFDIEYIVSDLEKNQSQLELVS